MINSGHLIILTQFHFLGGLKKALQSIKNTFYLIREEIFYYPTLSDNFSFSFPVFQRNLRQIHQIQFLVLL